MDAKVKNFSLNINGLLNNIKRKRLKSLLRNINPEVVLLQETYLKRNSNTILKDKTFPYQWHSNSSSKARGTAILLHRRVQFHKDATLKEKQG